jgi:hypothetical protein
MKGDPGGTVSCPICGAVRHVIMTPATRNGHVSTVSALRAAIRQHFYGTHPGLSVRERSLRVDMAVRTALLGGEIISAPGASR